MIIQTSRLAGEGQRLPKAPRGGLGAEEYTIVTGSSTRKLSPRLVWKTKPDVWAGLPRGYSLFIHF